MKIHKISLDARTCENSRVLALTANGWMTERCVDILNKCQAGTDGSILCECRKRKKLAGWSPAMVEVQHAGT